MIRVIGVDIPRGWSVVDVEPNGQSTGVAFGELDEGREVEHFAEIVEKYQPAKVAIETPLEPYVHGRGSTGNEGQRRSVIVSLISCAILAGRIIDRAWTVARLAAIVTDASKVRKALGIGGRTQTDRDRLVKAYVMTHVRGWPKQSNADERDACAVAIYGGRSK
jgi:Holliday junction resolvasome RuvABC endonuclease subunit